MVRYLVFVKQFKIVCAHHGDGAVIQRCGRMLPSHIKDRIVGSVLEPSPAWPCWRRHFPDKYSFNASSMFYFSFTDFFTHFISSIDDLPAISLAYLRLCSARSIAEPRYNSSLPCMISCSRSG